jgi:hypothetical protein
LQTTQGSATAQAADPIGVAGNPVVVSNGHAAFAVVGIL